jgi:hypothetical protein
MAVITKREGRTMMDKMNRTPVDNNWLHDAGEFIEEVDKLIQSCKSNDDDNMEFVIELTCFQRDRLVELLQKVKQS